MYDCVPVSDVTRTKRVRDDVQLCHPGSSKRDLKISMQIRRIIIPSVRLARGYTVKATSRPKPFCPLLSTSRYLALLSANLLDLEISGCTSSLRWNTSPRHYCSKRDQIFMRLHRQLICSGEF